MQSDLDFIQSVRAKSDRLYYSVVQPHFTIVFPVSEVPYAAFSQHVRAIGRTLHQFQFVLRCAVLDKDAFNEYTHVFLVPDEGYSNIVKIHDMLYAGILTKELRLDLPFIPHIGIANDIDPQKCKGLATGLNCKKFSIAGVVEELTLVEFSDGRVTDLESIPLVEL